mgnify:CR=1 FL=1
MTTRRTLLAALPALGAAPALAQAPWPPGPVRGICPFAPGSATDTVARLFAEAMRPSLGQPIIVENRAGAGGMLGAKPWPARPPTA